MTGVWTGTFDDLMRDANCLKFPERWRDLFDEVMADYNENGCPLTNPTYYEHLSAEYGILSDCLDAFQGAAVAVGKSEPLARFLALLVRALRDREYVFEDLKCFGAPTSPDGGYDVAYDMLTGLAICSLVPRCRSVLQARGLPEEMIQQVLRFPDSGLREYRKRNGNADGYHLLEWFQRVIEGRIFRIGRLEIELGKFGARATVFRSRTGETVTLAHDITLHRSGFALGAKGYEDEAGAFTAEVTETADTFEGYPYLENGFVSTETVTLPKAEWEKVLEYGDPAVSLHIPPTGPLTEELVDETLKETKAFLSTYFPEFRCKAFYCASWLMDPQLETMLGADSNIAKFGRRFQRLTRKSAGNAVFNFVFLKPTPDVDPATLPETTRLERGLKRLYLDGNVIYEMHGFFF